MKYRMAIKQAMEELATKDGTVFLGYNVKYGSRAYGTLSSVPESRCLETPLAENLMMGLANGMSLEGFRPVVFFERHDFLLNALDAIVNHTDKISLLSREQFRMPVIIRAVVGARHPLEPGLQHRQDYTSVLKNTLSFPVIELKASGQINEAYREAGKFEHPTLLVEWRDLYDTE